MTTWQYITLNFGVFGLVCGYVGIRIRLHDLTEKLLSLELRVDEMDRRLND